MFLEEPVRVVLLALVEHSVEACGRLSVRVYVLMVKHLYLSGGSVFGGTSSSSATSPSGAFSGGMGQTISQSGFGSPTAFQNKPGIYGIIKKCL